jgi:SAM-dependent methyltransferase
LSDDRPLCLPFADHFSAIASAYATARPTYPPALFAWLSELAPARHRAWDCAAGNGQAALPLARYFAEVVATDASRAQIGRTPPHPNVHRYAAAANASALRDASAELVTVAQALHWLPRPAFWIEARRVLVGGGVLAVWCYGIQHIVDDREVDRLVEQFYHDVVGPFWAPERRLVETGYRDLEFPFDERPTPEFRMARDWRLAEFLAYVRTWSATHRFVVERGADPVVELEAALAPRWGTGVHRVQWPLSLRVGRRHGS